MERADKAARELREGLEKLRQVVTDHRDRMVGTTAPHQPAANDEAAGEGASVDGSADNDR
jgi:hypothetical protein